MVIQWLIVSEILQELESLTTWTEYLARAQTSKSARKYVYSCLTPDISVANLLSCSDRILVARAK